MNFSGQDHAPFVATFAPEAKPTATMPKAIKTVDVHCNSHTSHDI